MTDEKKTTRQSVLDPIERSSEVLFGLIMVLSFTGSISVASAHHEEIRTMFLGALGCNLAWGIVDAIMYVLNTLGARGRELKIARDVRAAKTPEAARAALAEALPDPLAAALRDADLAAIAARVRDLPEPPLNPRLRKSDFTGAASVFLLVFVSTLPVVIPFAAMKQAQLALRISNGIAIAMLFLTGLSLGRYSFKRPWAVGVVMVAIGLVLVSITMALGG
jgi:VIT1/CCC1 family predicted Fe2+/Mn2+ transporter